MSEQLHLQYAIFKPDQALEAVRASGFKSTAEAIFELIDNSIDAGSQTIEVFGVTQLNPQTGYQHLVYLAVLDDGHGMDAETLRSGLRFGGGTHFGGGSSIGRFGVGLPQASVSQAERVDVWSWQAGSSNAIRGHLSTREIRDGTLEVPEPQLDPIPEVYAQCSKFGFSDSGTLVVWSDLSSITWRQATTTFRWVEKLVGRVYRRFLEESADPRITIDLVPVEKDNEGTPNRVEDSVVSVAPNDPLFLMSGTSSPEGFGAGPMFQEHPQSPYPIVFPDVPVAERDAAGGLVFDEDGKQKYEFQDCTVTIRCSYARRHARRSDDPNACWPDEYESRNPGETPWGKRAAQNLGVSVMRADRELELQVAWAGNYDPVERWWGIEVDFPPELDTVFGVTNNKQSALRLVEMANFDWETEAYSDETARGHVLRRLRENGDLRANLVDLADQIKKFRGDCLTKLGEQTAGTRGGKRHEETEEERSDKEATKAIRARIDDGNSGESDRSADGLTADEILGANTEHMIEVHGFEEENALAVAVETIEAGNRVRIISTAQDSPAFFTVGPLPATLQVVLNTRHRFYDEIWRALNSEEGPIPEEEYEARLEQIKGSLRLLLYSWARMEDEASGDLQQTRWSWGSLLDEFLQRRPGRNT